ncbi:pyocin activator PrtN family protein [Pseudomonas phage PG1]|nr:pyocin activator PrtN family protein [Pseudomonas phage PG1]
MSSTYQQLLRRYDRPCLPLDEVRAEYLPHIASMDHLMEEIRKGVIRLRYVRLTGSRRAAPVVYLRDLAAWLDAHDPSNTQPATDRVAS